MNNWDRATDSTVLAVDLMMILATDMMVSIFLAVMTKAM
jgi:hypothetical protein